jgi:putative spermidine/putrescine transport system substrate-binding protein
VRLTRSELVGGGLALAGLGSLAAACAQDEGEADTPPPFAGTLRVLGLPFDLTEAVRRTAERDLGFEVAFEPTSPEALVERVLSRPGSFDLLSGYTYLVDRLWPSGNLVGLDRTRIDRWGEVSSLYKLGKLSPGGGTCTVGDGDAPFRTLYTAGVGEAGPIVPWGLEDGSGPPEGEPEPLAVAGAPSTYSMDSIGYDADVLGLTPPQASWAELFNSTWRGRVALANEPTTGFQDSALAAQALGLVSIANTGNPSRAEIDSLTGILLDLSQRGQFRAFWSTFDESVDLMAAGDVAVQSMSWPAVSLLQSARYPVHYASPPEGHRGSAGLLFVSKQAAEDESRLQACHDYVNWWHAGVPGAILMRYGYYNAVQATTRELVSVDDWDWWIEGEPAATELDTPFAQRSIEKGQVRDGGSIRQRSCSIATWTSGFDEAEYASERWNEVVAS